MITAGIAGNVVTGRASAKNVPSLEDQKISKNISLY